MSICHQFPWSRTQEWNLWVTYWLYLTFWGAAELVFKVAVSLSIPTSNFRGFQCLHRTSLVAQTVKRLSTMWETRVRSLGWEDPLEQEMAIHSSTIAWKIPWTEETGRLQSMESWRVRHDWVTSLSLSLSRGKLYSFPFVLICVMTQGPIRDARVPEPPGKSILLLRKSVPLDIGFPQIVMESSSVFLFGVVLSLS